MFIDPTIISQEIQDLAIRSAINSRADIIRTLQANGMSDEEIKAVFEDLYGNKRAQEAKMNKTLAGQPLTIGVEGEELVIRIGVDTLQFCFEAGEDNLPWDDEIQDFIRSFKVTDKYKFAKGVGNALCNEEEDGSTPLTKILDEAFIDAVENAEGVEEDGEVVTPEMLNYHGSELPDSSK